METAILVLIVALVVLALVFNLIHETARLRMAVGVVDKGNNTELQDLLVKHEQILGGVVVFTDGTSQVQIAGRVTGMYLRKDGVHRHLHILTDIPFNTEASTKKGAGESFHEKEITLHYVEKASEYFFGSYEDRGIFIIMHGGNHRLVTLVTKECSDEFLKWRKEYHEEYSQNSLESKN